MICPIAFPGIIGDDDSCVLIRPANLIGNIVGFIGLDGHLLEHPFPEQVGIEAQEFGIIRFIARFQLSARQVFNRIFNGEARHAYFSHQIHGRGIVHNIIFFQILFCVTIFSE